MCGRSRSGVPRYVCPNVPGTGTCGGTATNAAKTDDHVRDMVLTALDSPNMAQRLRREQGQDTSLADQMRADEEQLEELAAAWAAREITRKEWMAARAPIEQRLEKARARLARQSRTSVLRDFVGTYEEMLDRWQRLNTSQRRAIVSATVRSITVHPANPRKKWDPDRFEFEWVA